MHQTMVYSYVNLALPNGYKMVLVDINDISIELRDIVNYIILDNESRIANYPGENRPFAEQFGLHQHYRKAGSSKTQPPYRMYTERLFCQRGEANGNMWIGYDGWPGSKIATGQQMVLDKAGDLMSTYIDKLGYSPIDYKMTEGRIDLSVSPGFTLVKDRYRYVN